MALSDSQKDRTLAAVRVAAFSVIDAMPDSLQHDDEELELFLTAIIGALIFAAQNMSNVRVETILGRVVAAVSGCQRVHDAGLS